MRPSLALTVARIVSRVPRLPTPAPTRAPEPKHRDRAPRGRRALRMSRFVSGPEDGERQALVNTMTNWQRSQWARAGYTKSLKKIRMFAKLPRRRAPLSA